MLSMAKLRWKPVLMTREDGSTYLAGDEQFNTEGNDSIDILRRIQSMPKQRPVSFQNGYRIVAEHVSALFEEDGRKAGEFLNEHGYFPEALIHMGYHVEISTEDFELVA